MPMQPAASAMSHWPRTNLEWVLLNKGRGSAGAELQLSSNAEIPTSQGGLLRSLPGLRSTDSDDTLSKEEAWGATSNGKNTRPKNKKPLTQRTPPRLL